MNQTLIKCIYKLKIHLRKKCQLLINKKESTSLKWFNDSKAFIEYSIDMDDIYKNIEEYNPNKNRKWLLLCLVIKKLKPIVTELLIAGRKLNVSLLFIKQSYFVVPKTIRLNSTHYFVMKNPNKREFRQIAFNHASAIDFQDFMNLYKKCTANTTLR